MDPARRTAISIAGIFLAASLLWIWVSSSLLLPLVTDRWMLSRLEIIKGAAYVSLASALIFWLVQRQVGDLLRARAREAEALRDLTLARSEEIRALSAMRVSEAKFRDLFARAPLAITISSLDGRLEEYNPAYCRLLGRSEAELKGGDITKAMHRDDLAEADARLRRLAAGEVESYEADSRYVHRSGESVWVHKVVSLLQGEAGVAPKIFTLIVDVSEARKASERLRVSEERLKAVLEITGEGVWDWSIDSGVVRHNPQWCRLLGLDEAYLEHSIAVFTSLLHPEDQAAVGAALEAARAGDGTYRSEHRLRHADGHYVWVEDRGRVVERSATGAATRMLGSMVEITARRDAETQRLALMHDLQASEERARQQHVLFRSVFDNAPDCLVLGDAQRRVTDVNPAFSRVFGYHIDDLTGGTSKHFFAEADDWDAISRHLDSANTTPITMHTGFVRTDGSRFPGLITVTRLTDGAGVRIGSVGIIRDITVEQARERALQEKRHLEALGRLTGGVAHDFNNLLTVVSGNLQLLRMADHVDEAGLRFIAEAERAADMGARLNQRLMTFARQRRLAPVTFDLNQFLQQMLDFVRLTVGESVSVKLTLEAGCAFVRADVSEMESTVVNLALNARDAMPNGGSIKITTSDAILDGANGPPSLPPGHYVRLVFADTGCGMPPAVRSRAFEPFFTTKALGKGTGLGLTTIHGFVAQSGGHIEIDSAVGAGTRVTILVPCCCGVGTAATSAPASAQEAPKVGGTVLLVEDNADVRRVTAALLRSLEFDVIEADNGTLALELLEQGPHVDALLSDVVLGGSLCGYDLAAEVRRRHPGVKVVLASGSHEVSEAGEAAEAAAWPLLRKPYSRAELGRALEREVV